MIKSSISAVILLAFVTNTMPLGHAQGISDLPVPGAMVNLSPAYEPVLIKGLKVDLQDPFNFDFIVDTGHTGLSPADPLLKEESRKLIKYFLAAITLPEKDLWVNLSPYEKDRMIPENLGQTEMGRDLLAQDYILKQLTASLIYPEKELGKAFWDRVYGKARQVYGSAEVPVNTFHKVWIVAERADVFEKAGAAYVTGAHLKVMMDEDYLALTRNATGAIPLSATAASQVMRQIVLPEIEKEVNFGKNFAPLRQMFYAMILSSWYKMALKDSILSQIYGNQSKVKAGVNAPNPVETAQIFERYLAAYKKGVFNYIKEDLDKTRHTPVPRKYFSGGANLAMLAKTQVLRRQRAAGVFPQSGRLISINTKLLLANDLAMAKGSDDLSRLLDDVQAKIAAPQQDELVTLLADLRQALAAKYPGAARRINGYMDQIYTLIGEEFAPLVQDLRKKLRQEGSDAIEEEFDYLFLAQLDFLQNIIENQDAKDVVGIFHQIAVAIKQGVFRGREYDWADFFDNFIVNAPMALLVLLNFEREIPAKQRFSGKVVMALLEGSQNELAFRTRLESYHRIRLAHRDFSPDNILKRVNEMSGRELSRKDYRPVSKMREHAMIAAPVKDNRHADSPTTKGYSRKGSSEAGEGPDADFDDAMTTEGLSKEKIKWLEIGQEYYPSVDVKHVLKQVNKATTNPGIINMETGSVRGGVIPVLAVAPAALTEYEREILTALVEHRLFPKGLDGLVEGLVPDFFKLHIVSTTQGSFWVMSFKRSPLSEAEARLLERKFAVVKERYQKLFRALPDPAMASELPGPADIQAAAWKRSIGGFRPWAWKKFTQPDFLEAYIKMVNSKAAELGDIGRIRQLIHKIANDDNYGKFGGPGRTHNWTAFMTKFNRPRDLEDVLEAIVTFETNQTGHQYSIDFPEVERIVMDAENVTQAMARLALLNADLMGNSRQRYSYEAFMDKHHFTASTGREPAMIAGEFDPGGIDLNRARMQLNVQKQGAGVPRPFDPIMLENMRKDLKGMDFEIRSMAPVVDLPMFMGV